MARTNSGLLKRNGRLRSQCILVVSALCLVFTAGFAARYIAPLVAVGEEVQVFARNGAGFGVYYMENDFFPSGTIPRNISYLMSFTDYIEIENVFSFGISKESEIEYRYAAAEILLIKHQRGSENLVNPVVYEERFMLSEIGGTVFGDYISFENTKSADGGGDYYVVDPKMHIAVYREFVRNQLLQMASENVATERTPAFSAELHLEFTLDICISEFEIEETLISGLRIPLTDEVFGIETISAPALERTIETRAFEMPSLPAFMGAALWVALLLIGIIRSIRQLTAEKDERRREAKTILRKYPDEIVLMRERPELSGYAVAELPRFRELLKIAVIGSRSILCFQDDEKTEFCVIDGGNAYCYTISYGAAPQ